MPIKQLHLNVSWIAKLLCHVRQIHHGINYLYYCYVLKCALGFVGISGFQYKGVSAGQHTITVRATSSSTGLTATATTNPFNVDLLAIFFRGITGKLPVFYDGTPSSHIV